MLTKKQMLGMTMDQIVAYLKAEAKTCGSEAVRSFLLADIDYFEQALKVLPELRLGEMKFDTLIKMMVRTSLVNEGLDEVLRNFERRRLA